MAQSVRQARRSSGAKKAKRTLSSGQVHVFASFNNTIVTVTDTSGNTIAWGSAEFSGLQGLSQEHPICRPSGALNRPSRQHSKWVCRTLDLIVNGPGPGRESAIRAVQSMGVRVRSISDKTPVAA